MDMLFARQPIFNTQNKVIAYELLYRNEQEGDSSNIEKTMDVLTNFNTFYSDSKETGRKNFFLNFDKDLLLDNIVDVLSPKEHVIEILESVKEEKIVIDRILKLKQLGFKFAVDDYTMDYKCEQFIDLADIIKVDFIQNSVDEIIKLSTREKFKDKILLAEKVENENMHYLATKLNYKFFQGYYYARPIVHKGNYISVNIKACLNILKELSSAKINSDDSIDMVDLLKVSKLIEKDPALTYKIIRIANSQRVNLYVKIDSINTAVTLLGYKKLSKWIKIIMFQDAKVRGNKKKALNVEVMKTIVIRTIFMENLLKDNPRLKDLLGETILASMIDMFDILFDMTMNEVVESLELSNQIAGAVLNGEGPIHTLLETVKSYENGDWDKFKKLCDLNHLNYESIAAIYLNAVQASQEIMDELGD